jgi:hypothetical protein
MKKDYFQYHLRKPMIRDVLKMPIRCLHERFSFLMEADQRNLGRFFKVTKSLFTLSEKGAGGLSKATHPEFNS